MKRVFFVLIISIFFLFSIYYASAAPILAGVTNVTHETYTGTGGATNATGGYIANRDLLVQSQTGAWQGYYGQVSGNLSLADASGDVMYAWTGPTISGEVFASMSSSIDWGTIRAYNGTNGTGAGYSHSNCTIGENITGTGSDRVNKTFTYASGPRQDTNIANNTIITDSACATETYVNGAQATNIWEEFILIDGTAQVVWAAEINDSGTAFDGSTEDFQLIVPANASTIIYYMYVELG
ncbi:MAG: hypothetical protein KAT43_05980 [Nanoarchaeota archaeon]|nr:hypothetical protein [Nanoarchaeota archaeon]